jgi:AcrR family transcriptional regulator
MRVADAEGFAAVSMRRLALELDVGTMTLYHYVRTKDELLTLVVDAAMADVVLPPDQPLPPDWRAAMTVIARRSRDSLVRHPWILDINDDPGLGPNSVRHFDQSLQAASSVSDDFRDQLDLVVAVDEYVFGFCTLWRNNFGPDGGLPADDQMLGYVSDLIATGGYPHLRAMVERMGLEAAWSQVHDHGRDPGRFERNLARLLDGFERRAR